MFEEDLAVPPPPTDDERRSWTYGTRDGGPRQPLPWEIGEWEPGDALGEPDADALIESDEAAFSAAMAARWTPPRCWSPERPTLAPVAVSR